MFEDTSRIGFEEDRNFAINAAADYDERDKYLLPDHVNDIPRSDWVAAVYSASKKNHFSKKTSRITTILQSGDRQTKTATIS